MKRGWPYLGMTANMVLLHCDTGFFALPNSGKLQWLDKRLAQLFGNGEMLREPRDLQPFPILGMPGWDKPNCCINFQRRTALLLL